MELFYFQGAKLILYLLKSIHLYKKFSFCTLTSGGAPFKKEYFPTYFFE